MDNNKNPKLKELKMEAAKEEGVHLDNKYHGDMKAKDAGHLGGLIGGSMVKKMVAAYTHQDKDE